MQHSIHCSAPTKAAPVTTEDLALSLQLMNTNLAHSLARLNSLCMRGCWPRDNFEKDHDLMAKVEADRARLLQACANAAAAAQLLRAHSMTCWPATYGQSPYGELIVVIRHAIEGLALRRGSTQVERDLVDLLVPQLAPPAARNRYAHDDERGRARLYARLLYTMREVALLTHGEADAVLRTLLRLHPDNRASSPASSEAVAYSGGNLRVLQRAWQMRHMVAARRRQCHSRI